MFKHLPKAQTEIQQKEKAPAVQRKSNQTGIPDPIKNRFEAGSGFSFDDVRVHYNSVKPAQLHALAYTQGSQVFVAPGQEKHLPHELGHVVQQKQGIVHPTTVVNGVSINDSQALERSADAIQFKSDTENRAVSSGQSGDIIQMRARNPYIDGNSLTGHHIIPHSLLVEMLGKLSANDQTAVKTKAVPNLTDITLRQLHNMNIIRINEADIQIGRNHISFRALQDTFKLNEASASAHNVPTTEVNYFLNLPIGQDLLNQINQWAGAPDTQVSKDNTDLLDSFFEWQAGNQFVAIKDRAEPGKSDEFDSDAQYIYNAEYVRRLNNEYSTLVELNKPDVASDLPRIKAALERIIDITRGKSVPASYNAGQWVKLPQIIESHLQVLNKGYLNESVIDLKRIQNFKLGRQMNLHIPRDFFDTMQQKIAIFIDNHGGQMRSIQENIARVQAEAALVDEAAVAYRRETIERVNTARESAEYKDFLSIKGLDAFLPQANAEEKFIRWSNEWNTFHSSVNQLRELAENARR